MADAVEILSKYADKAEKASDPAYRRDHIKEAYPAHYEFIMDIVSAIPTARLVLFESPTLKWERPGIIKGQGVLPSLDHRRKKK